MYRKRTDLALEAAELWRESAGSTTRPEGVIARDGLREGYPVTRVEILDRRGEEALGKPAGRYLTVDLSGLRPGDGAAFSRAVRAVGTELRSLLPAAGPVLVVGLGNAAMTPDAVGPLTLEHLLVTRHLLSACPGTFAGLRPVAAAAPGVLGTTGIEAAEAVRGLAARIRPAALIAVDALAARRTERVCTAVQLSDTGIVPGSGVGNRRAALNAGTLGVPVIALGVPTVVDGATLAADLLEEAGVPVPDPGLLRRGGSAMTVTLRDIDARVQALARVMGCGINYALQGLLPEETAALL